jgi:sulfate/thiosulfate transport system substrate-binding protein
MENSVRDRKRSLLALAAVTALVVGACGTGGTGGGETLSLVGFAVSKAANDAIETAWSRTPEGQGVRWRESYGASGDQSRAVESGLHADYVHLSLETDVTRLVDAGRVDPSWKTGPTKGIVSQSVVVLAVRKGNPKNIRNWDDIVSPGVGIVTPNPGSSGAARWNILAAYGHVLADGGTDKQAEQYLTAFFRNVDALPGSSRDATTAFTGGTGDVLVTYENEAILARQSGEDFDYMVPDTTLLIENPGAVLIDAHPKAAKWLTFVLGRTGQTEFARKGFRPVGAAAQDIDVEVPGANDPANPFPTPKTLLTIDEDFGGWDRTVSRFFDAESGLVTRIQKQAGKP